jgi:DNA-binding transcriptional regulator YiaG
MAEYKVVLGKDIFSFEIETQKISHNHASFLKSISDEKSGFIPTEAIKSEDIVNANKEISTQIIQKDYNEITYEHFNFMISAAGIRGKELAELLEVDQSHISQWRKGQKKISKAYWKLSCIILFDIIKHGLLTIDPILFKRKAA